MAALTRRPLSKQDWLALATRAFQSGDFKGARVAYAEALRHERKNADIHFDFAAVLAALGEIEDAIVHLTHALRLKPQHEEAARRLARLLGRFSIPDASRLEPYGLKAALASPGVDLQPITEVALKYVIATSPELATAIEAAQKGEGEEAARKLILHRTSEALKSDLLLTALQTGVVMDAGVERLLTALRRVLLLEVPAGRFEDRALYGFTLAMLAQVWNNDHVWAETDAEIAAIDQLEVDKTALLAGDLEMARRLVLWGLYRPVETILPPQEASTCANIRPKPVREAVQQYLERRYEEQQAAASIPRLAPLGDEASKRVAQQYEASPYPRWRSLYISRPGSLKATLERFFEPSRLAFMDGPFDVLIAGAGTGKQALQSAYAYGRQARVLATDLSAASLGYAQAAAKKLGASNVEFMIADILDMDRLDRQFDIIECVGVLHHMADPWAGWRKLLSRLKPGGLMYIGLYSATARANIRELWQSPDYPGPDCDDRTARAWRAQLLNRAAGQPGAELVTSRDFYTLHEFRDLALHAAEQHVTLEEIERFLNENGLAFRGFTLDPLVIAAFAKEFPDSKWPGALADWQSFEKSRPQVFEAMYRFWCDRLPTA